MSRHRPVRGHTRRPAHRLVVPLVVAALLTTTVASTLTFARPSLAEEDPNPCIENPAECLPSYPPDYPPQSNPPRGTFAYVALGDSYSSGTAAGSYRDDNASGCYESENGYPYLIKEFAEKVYNFAVATVDVLACHGATIDDVAGNQLGYVNRYIDLVTITIGGNDLGFRPGLEQCILHDCSGAPLVTIEQLVAVRDRLVDLYRQIRQRMHQDATFIVLTYPYIFPDLAIFEPVNCPVVAYSISVEELARIRDAAELLRLTVQGAVQVAQGQGINVDLVDTHSAFKDAHICSSRTAATGIWPDLSQSFHPNEYGHQLMTMRVTPKIPFLTWVRRG